MGRSMKGMLITVFALLAFAASAIAAGPAWMPNFPMRMGAAGVMGMWMPLPGVTEYKVFRMVGGGNWEQIAKGPANNFQDPTAPQDKDVSYKVVPVAGGADGEASPVAKLAGLKPIDPPKDLAAIIRDNTIQVRWGVVAGASFYNLYRSEAKEGPFGLLSSAQDTKYTDSTGQDGKTYYYQVSSVSSSSQESPKSESFELKYILPKKVVQKRYDIVKTKMTLAGASYGEEFAEFQEPLCMVFLNNNIFVADKHGVTSLTMDGEFIAKLKEPAEKIASGEWGRILVMTGGSDGNLYLYTYNSPSIKVVSPAGAILREIVIPNHPEYAKPSVFTDIAVMPDGGLVILDGVLYQLISVPAGIDAPTEKELKRYGWPVFKGKPPEGEKALGSVKIVKYSALSKGLLLARAREADVELVDPATFQVKWTTGGQGTEPNKLSSIASIWPASETSVTVMDALSGEVKTLDSAGDYKENFVDNDEKLSLKGVPNAGLIAFAQVDGQKRMYLLCSSDGTLYIFTY